MSINIKSIKLRRKKSRLIRTSGVSGTGSDTGTGGIQDGKRQFSPEEKAAKEEAELKKVALFQADKDHAEGVLHKMKSPSLWKGVKEAYPDIKDNPTAVANGVAEVAKRSEEHTSELQSPDHLVCRLLLEKKKIIFFF